MGKGMLASCVLAIALAVAAGKKADAAVLNDPTVYGDLDQGVFHHLNDFVVTDLDNGPATLSLRYGRWTGSQNTVLDFAPYFNGVKLATIQIDNVYYSTPTSFQWDVTNLISSGANTLSVIAAHPNDNFTTYGVGDATLDYTSVPAVPLPASLPMLVFGVAGLGILTRRRTQKSLTGSPSGRVRKGAA